jgi:5-methylthioadenosine/S-adenosylhomocysteine deaminase
MPAVAPHAIYTNSEETLRAARTLASRYDVPLLIHLSETAKENQDAETKHGRSPTSLLALWGILSGRTLAAHAVHLGADDIATLAQHKTAVAHCPSSNMMLASGTAPVPALLKAGIAVGLGTDGPAGSNNDLNMFEEMDLAAKLAKIQSGMPTALTAQQVVEMATLGGARAVGLADEIGSIEAGKRADLIVVRTSNAHAQPLYEVYSALVYSLKASDVQHVMVNGRFVVRNREAVTLNGEAVLATAARWRRRILESLGK